MTASNEEMRDSLLRTGIVSETQIAEFTRAAEVDDFSVEVIEELVAAGCLTPYQASRVRQGCAPELVVGKYLILHKIGAGGMGVVFKALHQPMDRVVAIKLVKARAGATDRFVASFHREVRAAARLNHPNVVAAYDADDSDAGPFLVMEYVEGSNLSEIVREGGPLGVPEALDVIRQAARGIAYAHSQGVVHRDIKPANLMRDIRGVVKVADLGIASFASAEVSPGKPPPQSETSNIAGSVSYMSPEQSYDADRVDHRTDIYSLGCTLFSLLNARPVFDLPTPAQRLAAHRQNPAPSLCEFRNDVPPALDALFQKMVAKDRDDRHATMQDVIVELDRLLDETAATDQADWNPADATVLIAEPSKTLTNIVGRLLAELGCHDVHQYETGAAVLDSLTQFPTGIVVASMELPDMTGLELAQRVRNDYRWSRTTIVLMTARVTGMLQQIVRRLSGVALLEKPFTGPQIQQVINDARQSCLIADSPIAGLGQFDVLIVDDSSVARRHVQQVLTDLGFSSFFHAGDGVSAAEEMDRRHFDLAVVDYHMPRMNGRQLVSHIRTEGTHRDLPIVICTNEFDPTKLAELYDLGVSAVCNKSFEPELVRNIVVRLFK